MRLLIVSNTYPPTDISGVASLAQEMARQFGANGHSVSVITREVRESDDYAVGVGGSKPQFPYKAAREYLRRARKERYDVVHVHESDGIGVALLLWLARLFRRPWARARLVATLQVSYDEERKQVRPVTQDGRTEVAWPTKEEKSFARWKARTHAFFGRLTVRLADQVVAPSHVTRGELERDYGAKNVEVVYNGIAVDDHIERASQVYEDRLLEDPTGESERVIYAGRIRTRKAVAVLLHAFRRVLDERPRAELVLAGDGEQFEALQELHEELELGDRVCFLGQQTREQVFEQLAQADVYCLPSNYEGFPVATLEAMAVGLPVVSTTVSGCPEAVTDGVHGCLVPPENADALARALVELLADPETRRRMGRAGRERVHEEFTIQTIAAKYLDLWQNPGTERD